jgi:hypothetical protein
MNKEKEVIEKHMINMFNKLNEFDSGMVDQITGNPLKDYLLQREKVIDNTIKLIADDIQKEWKVIASGEVEVYKYHTVIDDLDLGNENDNDLLETINKYSGKTIEIAVRIIDETKE